MAKSNVPIVLAAVGTAAVVYYATRKKPAVAAVPPEKEPGIVTYVPPSDADPFDPPHPGFPPAPTPQPPPGEPPPPKGGVTGTPWSPPPKPPVVPACEAMAKIYEGEMALPSEIWTKRGSSEITVLVPSADCNKYKLAVGICIEPVGYEFDPAKVFPPKDAFTDKTGQLAHNIDWNEFKSPIWKDIFESTIEYVNNKPKAPLMLFASTEPEMVPKTCKELNENWPTPQGAFYVLAEDGTWKKWNPVPKFSLTSLGKTVKLKIEFSGFPSFKLKNNKSVARLDKKSTVKITYKVWHIGI